MTTARYGFAVQGETGQTLDTPRVRAILDLNFKYTKRALFPTWTEQPQMYTYNDPVEGAPVFQWDAFVPTEFILAFPRDHRQTMADEFEEANPGVQFPYFWSGDGTMHSRATGLPV